MINMKVSTRSLVEGLEKARKSLESIQKSYLRESRERMEAAGMPPPDVDAAMELIDAGHASADKLIALWRALTPTEEAT